MMQQVRRGRLPLLALLIAVTAISACSSTSSPESVHPTKATARDVWAQVNVEGVVSDAEAMAGGRTAKTFSEVTLEALQHQSTDVTLTTGDATWRKQMVSVNVCANGPVCTEIEAASQGNPNGYCWYTRSVYGQPNSQGVTLNPSFGWTPDRSTCFAGTEGHPVAPSSGWKGYIANPDDCPSNGSYPPPGLCREDS
jgi:hypothetical protein